ncbi:MAG: DoxX family membrane protein [Gemmatimonadaceae bacterium]
MSIERSLDRLHARARASRWLGRLTVLTRVLLALGFLPSGLTKVMGAHFTKLGLDDPVGFFFEAIYRTGIWYPFIGWCQVIAALLLLVPRTATLGAVLYFPIILNIFLITVGVGFTGTPFITGPMLLGATYLLCWDYDRWKGIVWQPGHPEGHLEGDRLRQLASRG